MLIAASAIDEASCCELSEGATHSVVAFYSLILMDGGIYGIPEPHFIRLNDIDDVRAIRIGGIVLGISYIDVMYKLFYEVTPYLVGKLTYCY